MARQFTKGVDLVRAQKARFAAMRATMESGLEDLAEAGRRDAVELASGGMTKRQTRGAFARGGSPAESTPTGRRRSLTPRQMRGRQLTGSVPLLPINVQSGKLRRGIRKIQRTYGDQMRWDLLIQGVPYAKYILADGGTKKMVARGYRAEIKRRARARRAAYEQFFRHARSN